MKHEVGDIIVNPIKGNEYDKAVILKKHINYYICCWWEGNIIKNDDLLTMESYQTVTTIFRDSF